MTIAFMITLAFLGMFVGFSAGQREEIKRGREDIQELKDQVESLTEKLCEARSTAQAHETTLNMIMEEVAREND